MLVRKCVLRSDQCTGWMAGDSVACPCPATGTIYFAKVLLSAAALSTGSAAASSLAV
jgi:hypothetical protein